MDSADQARSDTAPRSEDIRLVKADLPDLATCGMKPFCHIAEPEIVLQQAFALSKLLEAAWRADTVADASHGLTVGGVSPTIHADALEGISSLIALGLHGCDLVRQARQERRAA